MNAADTLQHQLGGYSESVATDIVRLTKFVFFPRDFHKNEDARQTAIELVLLGHPAATAIRHARAQVARDFRQSGFINLDEKLDDTEPLHKHPLHERIAAPQQEEIERWRTAVLDDATEAMLLMLADGAASLASCAGLRGKRVTKRRAQQIVTEAIDRIQTGDLFCRKRDDDGEGVLIERHPTEPIPGLDAVEVENEQ